MSPRSSQTLSTISMQNINSCSHNEALMWWEGTRKSSARWIETVQVERGRQTRVTSQERCTAGGGAGLSSSTGRGESRPCSCVYPEKVSLKNKGKMTTSPNRELERISHNQNFIPYRERENLEGALGPHNRWKVKRDCGSDHVSKHKGHQAIIYSGLLGM